METLRARRVADLLLAEISRILRENVKDPRIGFLTLTAAEVSSDLKSAKIYFSVLGEESSRVETSKGLTSAKPFIRREVARCLRLKKVPDIRFVYDESVERGFVVEERIEGNS